MFSKIKQKLDTVSPTFCLAKWTQSTINLSNGETHSCHHPGRHKIPLHGLSENPKILHNTPIKIFARQELLNGVQTRECDYCWRIENTNNENSSDRLLKSHADWSLPFFDKVVESGTGENFDPTYVEIMFENTCNFGCVYCLPDISSRIMEDAESNGPYQLKHRTLHDVEFIKKVGKYPINRHDHNPYTEAFWKWWPELYTTLHTFRITGGEPLLSKHTWKIFEYIKENPNTELELCINTNLGVPDKLIARLIDEIRNVQSKVKKVKIFTSFEATGSAAEYIRYGMEYSRFMNNIIRISKETNNVAVVVMTTHNVLCAGTIVEFFEEARRLRNEHFKFHQFIISVNYLRHPPFLDIRLLPGSMKKDITTKLLFFVNDHASEFHEIEKDQILRLIKFMNLEAENKQANLQDLKAFLIEHDRRRGTDHTTAFSAELIEWINTI
jgi:organic radical activating enzyme